MPYKAKLTTRTLTASNVTADNLNKGSELTFQQADSNFLNLRDQSIGIASDDSTTIDIGMGNTLKVAGSGTVTTSVSGQTLTITSTGAANLGDLQANGTTLSPINTNSDLTILANGTGQVIIEDLTIDELPTDEGAQPAGLYLKAGTNQSNIGFYDNGTLYLTANGPFSAKAGTGYDLNLYTTTAVRAINSTKFVIGNTGINPSITSYSGTLTINTADGTNSGSIVLNAGSNGNIAITPNGTGSIVLDGLNWPQADGTSNQVIKTNGSGQLSFTSINSIASTYVHNTITDPFDGSTNPTNINVDFANGAMQTISLAGDTYDIQTPSNMTTGSILYLLFDSTRVGGSNVGFPSGYNAYGNGRFGVNQNQRVIWTIFYNGTDYIATTSANLST